MTIVVCYDGSPSSRSAVTKAAAVLAGQPALLLHVWSPPAMVLADAFSTGDPHEASAGHLEDEARRRADEIAEQGRQLAQELGLDAQARTEPSDSDVWRTILEVAGSADAELIVVGTRGATAVQDAPLGSVSDALVRHSDRAVLIVPDGDRSA